MICHHVWGLGGQKRKPDFEISVHVTISESLVLFESEVGKFTKLIKLLLKH